MTHIWIRAEQRDNERRTPVTPEGVSALLKQGFDVTVEDSATRIIPTQAYAERGAAIAPEGSWEAAPHEAIILGLKELPDADTPLRHHHIMFGHAFKGQHSGQHLLKRFQTGDGTLLDLEYLVDENERRVAAFGYWAGFAGAAVSVMAWVARESGDICAPVHSYENKEQMIVDLRNHMGRMDTVPTAIIIGALGRVGKGAGDLCEELGIAVTGWDMVETAHGGPFPEILDHDLFFNCILARPETPRFITPKALETPHQLGVIGDIACDPDSYYNPVPLYNAATNWESPVTRVKSAYPLDVMAIDNLPSLLPLESSQDFAEQLLPYLRQLDTDEAGVWARAESVFLQHGEAAV